MNSTQQHNTTVAANLLNRCCSHSASRRS